MEVVVDGDALGLVDYPFPGRRRVVASEIAEVCVGWAPPSLRTHGGEYVFVPAPTVRTLADFAQRYRIPFVRREDVWSLLLEPFLDTEFDAEHRARTEARLDELAVDHRRVRALVGARMLARTACTWEWCHYGLFDVLEVMRPLTITTGFRFAEFARYAMSLADRGAVEPSTASALLAMFPARER